VTPHERVFALLEPGEDVLWLGSRWPGLGAHVRDLGCLVPPLVLLLGVRALLRAGRTFVLGVQPELTFGASDVLLVAFGLWLLTQVALRKAHRAFVTTARVGVTFPGGVLWRRAPPPPSERPRGRAVQFDWDKGPTDGRWLGDPLEEPWRTRLQFTAAPDEVGPVRDALARLAAQAAPPGPPGAGAPEPAPGSDPVGGAAGTS